MAFVETGVAEEAVVEEVEAEEEVVSTRARFQLYQQKMKKGLN